MPSLNSSIDIALQSLMVQQKALNVTSNNIANANTPGYTRERVVLSEGQPYTLGNISFGTGVTLDSVESVRDQLLQLRIYDEISQQAGAQSQLNALQQIEPLFSNPDSGIGSDLQAFFNSLNQLSTDPTSLTQRQAVLSSANTLARDFQGASSQIANIKSSLDASVQESVGQINLLTQQIATLNAQIAEANPAGQDGGTLQDKLTALTEQLAAIVPVRIVHSEHGDNITLPDGTPLVVGNESVLLSSGAAADGSQHVFSLGNDVTAGITGGSLGGIISARSNLLPSIQASLDALAYQVASGINNANRAGFDLNGAAGGDFFVAQPSSQGAAATMAVQITDPNLIAASSDGAVGDNGNIANLLKVRDTPTPPLPSPTEGYANLVFQVGNFAAAARSEGDAAGNELLKLQDQRSSLSGVSIDEEATNLIKYQRAYEAAARVITTVDEMTQTILTMGAR